MPIPEKNAEPGFLSDVFPDLDVLFICIKGDYQEKNTNNELQE